MAVTLDRRQRKKQQTRRLIQNTALEMFASRGYRETTIGAIAEASDVAARTVTLHFPAKEDLLFADELFTAESLAVRLDARTPGEETLDALRDWMAATMRQLSSQDPDDSARAWQRRALRSRLLVTDDDLRGRARAGYYPLERLVAAGIGHDLGQPADALTPRLASVTVVTGLREIYETSEAKSRAGSASDSELLALVDRVLAFSRAGIAALHGTTPTRAP